MSTSDWVMCELERLRESVRRLSYLAVDKGYGVWRCIKCDQRYTTLPDARAVCGEVLTTYTAEGPRSASCLGKLEPYVYEASDKQPAPPASPASAAPPRKHAPNCYWLRATPSEDGDEFACCDCGASDPSGVDPSALPATGADEAEMLARDVADCIYGTDAHADCVPAGGATHIRAALAQAANDALEMAALCVDGRLSPGSGLASHIRALKAASGAEGQP